MKVEEALNFFSNLSNQERVEFLVRLGHELTIEARDSYEIGTENISNQSKIRRINEIQHRIFLEILALVKRNEKSYPDDVLMRMILEHREDKSFEAGIAQAFKRVADRFPVAV
ncbi:MAG TPA: hypothetical protein VF721_09965 [Pyrinomonadaceae bacterium]|jgi:hypothetical protein